MTTGPDSRADAWLERARARLGATALGPQAEQIGRVEKAGDGIALISGLPNVRLDELLRFDKGQYGFAQVLERDRVGCVLLDDVDSIEAGDTVHGTGDVVCVPVGPALLGRVVDPLGRPLDAKLADEVALVLAVQSGLLDPLPLPVVIAFRQGLRAALDRDAPDAIRMIEATGALDDAREQMLRNALRQLVERLAPTMPAKTSGPP